MSRSNHQINIRKFLLAAALIVTTATLGGCKSISWPSFGAKSTPASRIAKAHGIRTWQKHEAFVADVKVMFGGRPMLEGRMWSDTSVGRTRIEPKQGGVWVFDGQTAWTSPASAKTMMARFSLLTWP